MYEIINIATGLKKWFKNRIIIENHADSLTDTNIKFSMCRLGAGILLMGKKKEGNIETVNHLLVVIFCVPKPMVLYTFIPILDLFW